MENEYWIHKNIQTNQDEQVKVDNSLSIRRNIHIILQKFLKTNHATFFYQYLFDKTKAFSMNEAEFHYFNHFNLMHMHNFF
ncbi:hypothetical protein [Secundilactobacillus collinoides]|uniref:hypothetical protein n=1 Tax=Secundilactobacillus collinoides TaxID=33960 RepID=UPI0006D15F8A|nr:hypothetical protein [Secundilactobacillus collinoides]